MTQEDRKLLFTALGFMAVTLQGGTTKNGATRAQDYATLIEEFCRTAVPTAFQEAETISSAESLA